jgi:hypothetical protein
MCEPSEPSARIHLAPFCTPHSWSSVDRRTPVHSQQASMPWENCSRSICAARHSMPPFAGHSRKRIMLSDGKRIRSSMLKISGRSTMPWIISRC